MVSEVRVVVVALVAGLSSSSSRSTVIGSPTCEVLVPPQVGEREKGNK